MAYSSNTTISVQAIGTNVTYPGTCDTAPRSLTPGRKLFVTSSLYGTWNGGDEVFVGALYWPGLKPVIHRTLSACDCSAGVTFETETSGTLVVLEAISNPRIVRHSDVGLPRRPHRPAGLLHLREGVGSWVDPDDPAGQHDNVDVCSAKAGTLRRFSTRH